MQRTALVKKTACSMHCRRASPGQRSSSRLIAAIALAMTVGTQSSMAAAAQDARPSELQQVLDRVVSKGERLGVLASVDAPRMHLHWTGAAGTLARDSSAPLHGNQPFRIASVTKVFVAAAIFRLIEDGALGLYDPIVSHVSAETASTLQSGGYDPKAITVAQLLGHTSGMANFGPSDAYERAVLEHQKEHKRWSRAEQIEFTIQHEKPVGRPGEKYAYSDTGYVILGEIIERASGKSLAAYVRESLKFGELHLHSTYWETLEPAPRGLPVRAHQYWGSTDVTDFDPSLDLYGGGGLVSTTADLNAFFRALLNGRLFRLPSTLSMALLPVDAQQKLEHPRALLLGARPFGRHVCWAHGGYWGTIAMYCPDIDATVSFTIDQTLDESSADNRRQLLEGLAAVLDGPAEGTQ